MENKKTTITDFEILGNLGEGAFGQVFKVRRFADNQIYALKKVKIAAMKQKERDNALNEIRILASYEGQHIVGYKDSFFDEPTNTLCVVMQFAAGGDLQKSNQTHTKKKTHYPQSQIWKALIHITYGIKSLHDCRILHRDIKAANIFKTEDGVYKLGDLNVSKVLKNDLARTQTGTPYYVSPEIWKDRPYGVKSDMWSLGCVIYEMAALRPPFMANDLHGLYKSVCTGIYPRIPALYSDDLARVINSLLKQDPALRPTTDQLLADSIVQQHSEEFLGRTANQKSNILLNTLKINHKNLRGIKHILPKSKYQKDDLTEQDKQKQRREQEEESSNTLRIGRKSVKNIRDNKKMEGLLHQQRNKQEKKRKNLLQVVQEDRQERSVSDYGKPRERAFSACGVKRNPQCTLLNNSEITPLPKRKESNSKLPTNNKNYRKENPSNNPCKLPPLPQVQNAYLHPVYAPIPQKIQNPLRNIDENRSSNGSNNESQVRPRKRSEEYFMNIGEKILKSGQSTDNSSSGSDQLRVRCNSAKKVVYPSWWMD